MVKKYNKLSEQSYALGVAPTLELLKYRSQNVLKVLINPKGSTNIGVTKIIELCQKAALPVEYSPHTIEKLAANDNTYAIGIFDKYQIGLNTGNHVLLVNPSDMGNLGTICRTMAGLNYLNLALIKPAVDIFDPKVIRASMGTVFGLNFEYFETLNDYQQKFANHIYTFTGKGAQLVEETKFAEPFTLIFGNEGEGLSESDIAKGQSIRLRQTDRIDSFNLATTVSIALYAVQVKDIRHG